MLGLPSARLQPLRPQSFHKTEDLEGKRDADGNELNPDARGFDKEPRPDDRDAQTVGECFLNPFTKAEPEFLTEEKVRAELANPQYSGGFDFAIDQYWDNKGTPAKITAQIKKSLLPTTAPLQKMLAVDKDELVYVLLARLANLLADGKVALQINEALNSTPVADQEPQRLDYVKGLYAGCDDRIRRLVSKMHPAGFAYEGERYDRTSDSRNQRSKKNFFGGLGTYVAVRTANNYGTLLRENENGNGFKDVYRDGLQLIDELFPQSTVPTANKFMKKKLLYAYFEAYFPYSEPEPDAGSEPLEGAMEVESEGGTPRLTREGFYSAERLEAFRSAVQEQDDIQKKYVGAFSTVSTSFVDLLKAFGINLRTGDEGRGTLEVAGELVMRRWLLLNENPELHKYALGNEQGFQNWLLEPIPGYENHTNRDYVVYLANSTIDKYHRRSKEQQVNFENATSATNGGKEAARLLQRVLDQDLVRIEDVPSYWSGAPLDKLWRFIAEMHPEKRTGRGLDATTKELVSLIQFRKANLRWRKEDNDELVLAQALLGAGPLPPQATPQATPPGDDAVMEDAGPVSAESPALSESANATGGEGTKRLTELNSTERQAKLADRKSVEAIKNRLERKKNVHDGRVRESLILLGVDPLPIEPPKFGDEEMAEAAPAPLRVNVLAMMERRFREVNSAPSVQGKALMSNVGQLLSQKQTNTLDREKRDTTRKRLKEELAELRKQRAGDKFLKEQQKQANQAAKKARKKAVDEQLAQAQAASKKKRRDDFAKSSIEQVEDSVDHEERLLFRKVMQTRFDSMFEPDMDAALADAFKKNYSARMGDLIEQARWERLYLTGESDRKARLFGAAAGLKSAGGAAPRVIKALGPWQRAALFLTGDDVENIRSRGQEENTKLEDSWTDAFVSGKKAVATSKPRPPAKKRGKPSPAPPPAPTNGAVEASCRRLQLAAAAGCNAGAKGAGGPLRLGPLARPAEPEVQALGAPQAETQPIPPFAAAATATAAATAAAEEAATAAARKVAKAVVFNKVFARELLARHFQMLFEVQCEAEGAHTKTDPAIDKKQAEQAASGAIRFGVAQSLHPIVDPEVRVYYNPVTEETDLGSIADSDDDDHVEYMLDRWAESVEDTLPFFEHMVRYRNTVIYAKLLLSRRDRELGVGAFGQKIEEEDTVADLVAAAGPAAPPEEPMALGAPLVPSVNIGVEAESPGDEGGPGSNKRARAAAKNPNDLASYSAKEKGTVNDFKDERGRTRTRRPRPAQTEAQKLRNKQLSKAKMKREAPFLNSLYVKPKTTRGPPGPDGRVSRRGTADNSHYSKQHRAALELDHKRDAQLMIDFAEGKVPGQLNVHQLLFLAAMVHAPPRVGKSACCGIPITLAMLVDLIVTLGVSPDKLLPLAEWEKKLFNAAWKRDKQAPEKGPSCLRLNYSRIPDSKGFSSNWDTAPKQAPRGAGRLDVIGYSVDQLSDLQRLAYIKARHHLDPLYNYFDVIDEAQALAKDLGNSDVKNAEADTESGMRSGALPSLARGMPLPPQLTYLRHGYDNIHGLKCLVTATHLPTVAEEKLFGFYGSVQQNMAAFGSTYKKESEALKFLGAMLLPNLGPMLKPFIGHGYIGAESLVAWTGSDGSVFSTEEKQGLSSDKELLLKKIEVAVQPPAEEPPPEAPSEPPHGVRRSSRNRAPSSRSTASEDARARVRSRATNPTVQKVQLGFDLPEFNTSLPAARVRELTAKLQNKLNDLRLIGEHFLQWYAENPQELGSLRALGEIRDLNNNLAVPEKVAPGYVVNARAAGKSESEIEQLDPRKVKDTQIVVEGVAGDFRPVNGTKFPRDPDPEQSNVRIAPMYMAALNNKVRDDGSFAFVRNLARLAHGEYEAATPNEREADDFSVLFLVFTSVTSRAALVDENFRLSHLGEPDDQLQKAVAAERRIVTAQRDAGLVALFYHPNNQSTRLAPDEDVVLDFFMSESAGDAISFANDDTALAKKAVTKMASMRTSHGAVRVAVLGFNMLKAGLTLQTAVAEPANDSQGKLATVTHYLVSYVAYQSSLEPQLDTSLQLVGRAFAELRGLTRPSKHKIKVLGVSGIVDTIYRYARLERNFADASREQRMISALRTTFDAAAVTDDGSLGTLGSVGAKLESILGIDRRMKRVLAAKKATGKLTEDEDIDNAYSEPIAVGPRASAQEAKRLLEELAAQQSGQDAADPDVQDPDDGDGDYADVREPADGDGDPDFDPFND